jgi:hypothetical protein
VAEELLEHSMLPPHYNYPPYPVFRAVRGILCALNCGVDAWVTTPSGDKVIIKKRETSPIRKRYIDILPFIFFFLVSLSASSRSKRILSSRTYDIALASVDRF